MKKTIEQCKGHKRYKGIRKPKCNGGNPCEACLAKFEDVQSKAFEKDFSLEDLFDATPLVILPVKHKSWGQRLLDKVFKR